ncbi:head maturation protease, ClpP-related [[Ruminococcus] torques]|uniref:head maturation protease, ClpP-related n=1 Tax=[Ruminococcus] torques TaxID=33039 RepID=UPI002ED261E1
MYDWWEEDSTCPRDVQKVIDAVQPGDEIEVYINSPGGVIDAGSEIYTLLRQQDNVKIFVTGQACSAASIIAMAGHCSMTPTSLMMVHCVSTGARGNHSDMEHAAEVLRTADKALSTAYIAKTGMSEEDALEMMEAETWLTAQQAKEKGLIDAIMFEESEREILAAGHGFQLPSQEAMEKARKAMKETETSKDESVFILQQKLNFLKLKGEKR